MTLNSGYQMYLFDGMDKKINKPTYVGSLSVPGKFLLFHIMNPHVYEFLEHEAKQVFDAKVGQVNIQYFFVRFRIFGARTFGNTYKITNSFSPYYARLLCMHNPRFRDNLFVLKELKGKNLHAWNKVRDVLLQYPRGLSLGSAKKLMGVM